jgi:hypothetical protein
VYHCQYKADEGHARGHETVLALDEILLVADEIILGGGKRDFI